MRSNLVALIAAASLACSALVSATPESGVQAPGRLAEATPDTPQPQPATVAAAALCGLLLILRKRST